jgi:mono/diheme cytochrome c family protein
VDGSQNSVADNRCNKLSAAIGETMDVGVEVRIWRLLQSAAATVLLVATSATVAQDNPMTGKTLFEGNTVQPCIACHTIDDRRAAIDSGGDLDFDLVYATFLNAVATVSVMNQFNARLSPQQKRDIAAYIADVPKARPSLVDFSATNTNTESSVTTITFSNAVTATSPLTLTAVGLSGSSADFLIKTTGTTCSNNTMLVAGANCSVNVSFMTSTGSTKVALLSFPYSQSGTGVTRTAQLTGTVANQPPPQMATPTSGGGGALGLGWAPLLLVALGLRRRKTFARSSGSRR